VQLHLRVLLALEESDTRRAEQLLIEINRMFPVYLPAMMERALLYYRCGEESAAAEWMREVIRRSDGLQPDEIVPGPEGLPVRFFVSSARAFLRSQGEPE
jgi:hypothetical protein